MNNHILEKYIELEYKDKKIRGMITQPQDTNKKYPILVIAHGFTGNRVDSKFIFTTFSRLLKKENIMCIRFDFLGSGESDGEFKDTTFINQKEELEFVLDYVKDISWVDKIFLLGFSMGGAISALTATQNDFIDKLILWSPAGNISRLCKSLYSIHETLKNGNLDVDGLEVGKELINQLQDIDVYNGVEKYKKPVLILHGTHDNAVPIEYGYNYHNIYTNSRFVKIEGSDHVYSSLKYRNQLFEESINFLRE